MVKRITRSILLIMVLFTGCNFDLYTKRYAIENLKDKSTVTIVNGYVEFSYVENRGMVFGALDKIESGMKFYLLNIVNLCAVLLMAYIIWRIRKLSFLYQLPFFLILAGASGNLINRIRLGYVIDFIHIHLKDVFDWPFLFNVADVLVLTGELLIIILFIFGSEKLSIAIFPQKSKI